MLSVMICQKSAQPFLDRYKSLFERFEEDGKIAFCFWDEHGTDAASILPEIQNIVHGQRQWRAVVVMPLTENDLYHEARKIQEVREDNPYDYLVNQIYQKELTDSEIPLVKLSWVLDDVPQVSHGYQGVIHTEDRSLQLAYTKTETETWLLQQQKQWQDLHDHYNLRCEKPVEIFFLKGRNRYPQLFPKEKDSEVLRRHESDSSMFWFRNRYASRCRFLIQDCVKPGQSRYQEDVFSFWMSALVLALSDFSSGTLENGKVYQVNPVINLDEIQKFYSVYYHHLRGIRESAFTEIQQTRIQGMMKGRAENPPTFQQDITVDVRLPKAEHLELEENQIGMTTDWTIEETSWLSRSVKESLAELKTIQRTVHMVLDRAGKQTRYFSVIPNPLAYEIDEYQFEALNEDLNELEGELLKENTSRILPFKKKIEELKAQRGKILDRMNQRMTRSLAIICISLSLLLLTMGFLPAVYYEIKTGSPFGDGMVLLVLISSMALLAGVLALRFYRRQVKKEIHKYNETMEGMMTLVRSAGEFFGGYLSNCCTYMRERSVLQALSRRSQMSSARISLLNDHINQLDNQLDITDGWLHDFNMKVLPDTGEREEVAFNFDIPPEENAGYSLPQNLIEKQIMVGDGQYMESPFPFIDSFHLKREPLFEATPAAYNKKTEPACHSTEDNNHDNTCLFTSEPNEQ